MENKIEHFDFVSSSTINSIDYDHLMFNMDIHFKNGGTYRFCGVPFQILQELKESESAGKYFHTNIKDKFDFIKK